MSYLKVHHNGNGHQESFAPASTLEAESNRHPIRVFYEDLGEGRPIVFIHGWPLSYEMWEYQPNTGGSGGPYKTGFGITMWMIDHN